jgi:hypothetical protein
VTTLVFKFIKIRRKNRTAIKTQYDTWASLNDEGKKEYGGIFPTGEVPIISIIGVQMQTGPTAEPELAYLIRQEDLTPEQLDKLLTMLAEKFKTAKDLIKKEMEKNRIPIRAKFTSGAGTTKMGMFLPDYGFDDDEDSDYGFDNEDYDDELCDEGYGDYF